MEIINWLAILAGTATAMFVGMIWYHPKVYGDKWMKAAGLTKKDTEKGQGRAMTIALLRAVFLSFALYSLIYVVDYFYADQSFLYNAFVTGLFVSIPIVGMTMLMHDTFEGRSRAITNINVLYEIVTIILVAIAIGLVAG